MKSIFLQLSKVRHFNLIQSKLILILLISLFVNTKDIVHQTQNTHCIITFQSQSSNNQDQKSYQFKNCIRKHCASYSTTEKCRFWQTFELKNQQNCLRQCCGSKSFSYQSCNQYNIERAQREEFTNRILIIVLSSCTAGLFIAAIIFAICYMKCCKNYEKQLQENIKAQNYDNIKSNFEIFWRPYSFKGTKQCQICQKNDAFIMLPCQQFYHLQCLKGKEQWKCSHCSKNIQKLRVFCMTCCKYYITLKAQNYQELQYKVNQAYQYHPEKCYQDVISEMQSDRKFTVSTKQ